jgi:hypothetical protein
MHATLILMNEHQPCGLCDHAVAVLRRVAKDVPLSLVVLYADDPAAVAAAEAAHAAAIRPVLILDGEAHAYGRISEGRLRRDLAREGRPG